MSSACRSVSDMSSRSEEHTSELQSRRDLVCRLLLEKKKEYDARYGEFQSYVVANRDANVEQLQQQMLSFNNQALSADNQLRPPVYPSLIATVLPIVAAAFNAYDKYQKAQPPGGGTSDS